jgi:glycerol kinase
LIWNLTGGAVHATDYSNASRTMLFNLHDLTWDETLMQLLDVPSAILPDVRPSCGVLGQTDAATFYGASVPVAGVAGDQHAALFGQTCFEKGMVKNTYGTGSFLLMHTGNDVVESSSSGLLTTVAWGIEGEPVEYALEGSVFISGAAVQWLRDGLGIIESAAETEAMARSLKGNDDVYFVPALAGLGAPHWDPYARGMIIGLTRGTSRAHLVRAALEAICYQSVDVVRAMERESGVALKELRADGGAVANGFLMQHQADVLQVPVQVPLVSETTALGAAYLAGLAVEFWASKSEIAKHWQQQGSFSPVLAADAANALHAKWLRAVERTRNWVE